MKTDIEQLRKIFIRKKIDYYEKMRTVYLAHCKSLAENSMPENPGLQLLGEFIWDQLCFYRAHKNFLNDKCLTKEDMLRIKENIKHEKSLRKNWGKFLNIYQSKLLWQLRFAVALRSDETFLTHRGSRPPCTLAVRPVGSPTSSFDWASAHVSSEPVVPALNHIHLDIQSSGLSEQPMFDTPTYVTDIPQSVTPYSSQVSLHVKTGGLSDEKTYPWTTTASADSSTTSTAQQPLIMTTASSGSLSLSPHSGRKLMRMLKSIPAAQPQWSCHENLIGLYEQVRQEPTVSNTLKQTIYTTLDKDLQRMLDEFNEREQTQKTIEAPVEVDLALKPIEGQKQLSFLLKTDKNLNLHNIEEPPAPILLSALYKDCVAQLEQLPPSQLTNELLEGFNRLQRELALQEDDIGKKTSLRL